MDKTIFEEEQQNLPISFTAEGMKIGIFNGVFALILLYGSYFLGLDTFISMQFFSAFIPYMIIVLIIYGFQLRRRNGGLLPLKNALQFSFVSYVIAAVLLAIGTYVLYNIIDKDLTEKSFTAGLEKTRRLMEKMGANETQIDQAMEKAEKSKKDTNLSTIFLGTGLGLIWDFVKSLVISLIIRKEKPAF